MSKVVESDGARRCLDCGLFASDDHECPEPLGHCDDCGRTLPKDASGHECPDLSDDEVLACPEPDCRSTSIQRQPTERRWYCTTCQEYFEEPECRPREGTTGSPGLNGGAKALWDADPSEYP